MNRTKFVLGFALPIVTAWAIRSKVRSERVADAPNIATYVKLEHKAVVRWAAKRTLGGRYRDREQPNKGRFTQSDVARTIVQTWHNYGDLAPAAHVEQLKTLGSRQNTLLGVLTHGLYRALLSEGVEKDYATELVSDLIWTIYETWIVLPRAIARLMARDPQKQMALMLRMFLRYPFSSPGYEWQAFPERDSFGLDIYRCPVHDYFKGQGEEEFMLKSWCTQDFALAQVMTRGGSYERPHTLSAGDRVCDMKWHGNPKEA